MLDALLNDGKRQNMRAFAKTHAGRTLSGSEA
jgi:hypothetical protein